MNRDVSQADLRQVWDLFYVPGNAQEVRIPGEDTQAGLFTRFDAFAHAVASQNGLANVDVFLNPRGKEAIPAASFLNRLFSNTETIKDKDVDRRRWMLIDCD